MGKLIFSTLILSFFTSTSVEAAVCGQLAGVKGKGVEILRSQSGRGSDAVRHALRIDENKISPLECDDIVLTGKASNAKIVLPTAKISMGPESRIELANVTGERGSATKSDVSILNLTYGKVRAFVAPQKADPKAAPKAEAKGKDPQARFRIRTFSAVAGVRGTDFYTSYDPNMGVTEQATLVGQVEVRQSGTGQSVVVSSGQQVAVETTASAVAAAQERIKSGDDALQAPREAPTEEVKPLVVQPLQESLKNEIRTASAVVRDEPEFTSRKAIEALGRPETWQIEREPVPDKMRKIKNEF